MWPTRTAAGQTMHEFMLAAADSTPEHPAIVECGAEGEFRTLTYRELQRRVNDYATALDGIGIGIGDRVMLESDNSAAAVAMLLACSSLGATFVPVSPDMPTPRLLAIASSVQPALHLQTTSGRRSGLPGPVGLARFGPEGVANERVPSTSRTYRAAASTDTAYMIFTSGTTGRPKGVVMSHRAVLAFYHGMLDVGFVSAADRICTTSPLQFDFSLLDIGLALGRGATLIPVPREVLHWPRRLVRFLSDTGVTQVNGVPSIWRSVLRHEPDRLAALADQVRGILFAGEAFPLPELRRLQSLLPQARIINCFGWTESIAASFADVPNPLPPDTEVLSVGVAYRGAEMMLLDPTTGSAVQEPGVVGEIYMRGPSLFTAYWADDEATAAALVPDPFEPRSGQRVYRSGDLAYRGEHGEFYFVGRADLQVQILGNRVELSEIERRLLEFPGVAAATVLVRPLDAGPELVAFLVLNAGVQVVDEGEVARFCQETLPVYMVPKRVVLLDQIPMTANGKTDRQALMDWWAERPPIGAGRTAVLEGAEP
jgi:amino acid adenylation domain-containing protein